MTDSFSEYDITDRSIQQLIEDFAVGLLMKGCKPPVKIVLDKHTYNRYGYEIQRMIVGDRTSGPSAEIEPLKKKVQDAIDQHVSSAGVIQIVCEE